jgi:hypothetical protein
MSFVDAVSAAHRAGIDAKEFEMQQYLLSIYQPDGPPPASVDLERIGRDLGALNTAMRQAGAWVFADGLVSPSSATVLRCADNQVLLTDGPYIESKEHLGGLTIINAASLDDAIEWGRKLAAATTLPVEVRQFHDSVTTDAAEPAARPR